MALETSSEMPLAPTSSELCLYQRHACSRPRYQKYRYCVEHVLEDSTSPFTSCEYTSRTSGRKCPNPALRSRRLNNLPAFCDEHLRDLIAKEQHQKQRKKMRKRRKTEKLHKGSHPQYAKRQKLIDQLVMHNQEGMRTSNHDSSDSEIEMVHRPIKDDWLLENSDDMSNNADWDDFDAVNNEVYEPLRYADVLTPEEVVATAQSKLIRLQSLYIEQFKRLFHLLKERRRQYLHDRKKEVKMEKMAGGSAQNLQEDDPVNEDEIYALATCRRRTGVDALLRKRQQKRRLESSGSASNFAVKSPPSLSRCSHISSHARCKGSCLPYTKYCTLHILEDPHQQLYKICHHTHCPTPVCFLTARPYEVTVSTSEDDSQRKEVCYCTVHAPLPEMTFTFSEVKKEDEDMEVDVVGPLEVGNDGTGKSEDTMNAELHPEETENAYSMDSSPEQSHTDIPDGPPPNENKADTSGNSGAADAVPCGDTHMHSTDDYATTGDDKTTLISLCDIEMPQTASSKEVEVSQQWMAGETDLKDNHSDSSAAPKETHTSLAEKILTVETDCAESSLQRTRSDEGKFLVDPVTGMLAKESATCAKEDPGASMSESNTSKGQDGQGNKNDSLVPNTNNNCSVREANLSGHSPAESTVLPTIASPTAMPPYISRRCERKPSSAEEELAVVSLLSLCTGHPSDDNTLSSSTDQE